MKIKINRRRHPRYTMPPAYTPVRVRTLDKGGLELSGHVYDISEGGARFEVDEPLEPGSRIAMQISLPVSGGEEGERGDAGGVFTLATVVRLEDEDEPGPVRTAAIFTHFARSGDRDRLLRQFATGRYRLAA